MEESVAFLNSRFEASTPGKRYSNINLLTSALAWLIKAAQTVRRESFGRDFEAFGVARRQRASFAAAAMLALLALYSDTVIGQEIPPDLSEATLEELGKIEVYSASRHLQSAKEAPSSVTVITADQIQKHGYRTLADILRTVRGFYVTYDRNYSFVGIRGLNRPGDFNTRVLLLIDGHRLNDNVYDQAMTGTEFPLDVDLIERVEVIRAPFPLYMERMLCLASSTSSRGKGATWGASRSRRKRLLLTLIKGESVMAGAYPSLSSCSREVFMAVVATIVSIIPSSMPGNPTTALPCTPMMTRWEVSFQRYASRILLCRRFMEAARKAFLQPLMELCSIAREIALPMRIATLIFDMNIPFLTIGTYWPECSMTATSITELIFMPLRIARMV